jgi:hypothetical protein
VKLGNPNGARALKGKQAGNAEAVAKLKVTAAQRATDLKAIVDDIKRSGITTTRGIAEELHVRGIRAPRGDTCLAASKPALAIKANARHIGSLATGAPCHWINKRVLRLPCLWLPNSGHSRL